MYKKNVPRELRTLGIIGEHAMATQSKYINITFDQKLAPTYFYRVSSSKHRVIGERYGSYILQFRSLASAKRSMLAYRKYAESLGYRRNDGPYTEGVYADISNHTAFNHLKLEDLKATAFYLNA